MLSLITPLAAISCTAFFSSTNLHIRTSMPSLGEPQRATLRGDTPPVFTWDWFWPFNSFSSLNILLNLQRRLQTRFILYIHIWLYQKGCCLNLLSHSKYPLIHVVLVAYFYSGVRIIINVEMWQIKFLLCSLKCTKLIPNQIQADQFEWTMDQGVHAVVLNRKACRFCVKLLQHEISAR